MDMNLSKFWEIAEEEPDMLPSMGLQTVGQDLKTEQQQQPQAQTKLFKNWEVSIFSPLRSLWEMSHKYKILITA